MAKQYGFYVQTDRCVQCHACEVACKSWNGIEPGITWRRVVDFWGGQFPNITNQSISFSCMHCAKPACTDVCPRHAISKRAEDGIVVVDPSECIGCGSCTKACPFHIPQHGQTGVMQKCNMCLDRLEQGKEPACAATCPGEALKFGTLEELSAMAAVKAAKRLAGPTVPSLIIAGSLNQAVFLTLFDSSR